MKVECLASSSSGNCYLISNEHTKLLVEAGLDFITTKSRLAKLGVRLYELNAIVITHQHQDHANKKALKSLNMYAPVITNRETIKEAEIKKSITTHEWKPININTFRITPFEVDHDVAANGYIIEDKESAEKILFINDTAFVRYNLSKHVFSRIMIECNHIIDIVDMNDSRARRQIKSHMSLGAVKKTLSGLNLHRVNEIYLMHLSDSHSDEKRMIDEIEGAFGIPTYACGKNGGLI